MGSAPCDRAEDKDGPLCYKELQWVETWLNRADVKKALGVPSKLAFTGCNMVRRHARHRADLCRRSTRRS